MGTSNSLTGTASLDWLRDLLLGRQGGGVPMPPGDYLVPPRDFGGPMVEPRLPGPSNFTTPPGLPPERRRMTTEPLWRLAQLLGPGEASAAGSPPEGSTGSIVWNWRDPRTVELYNTQQYQPSSAGGSFVSPPQQDAIALSRERKATGDQGNLAEGQLRRIQTGRDAIALGLLPDRRESVREYRHLDTVLRGAERGGGLMPHEAFPFLESLMRSGAIQVDETGRPSFMFPYPGGRKGMDRVTRLIDMWAGMEPHDQPAYSTDEWRRRFEQQFPRPR